MTNHDHAWTVSAVALLALNAAVLAIAPDGPLSRSSRSGGKSAMPATAAATTSGSSFGNGTPSMPGTLRIVGVVTSPASAAVEAATTFADVLPPAFAQPAVGVAVRFVMTRSRAAPTAVSVDAAPSAS